MTRISKSMYMVGGFLSRSSSGEGGGSGRGLPETIFLTAWLGLLYAQAAGKGPEVAISAAVFVLNVLCPPPSPPSFGYLRISILQYGWMHAYMCPCPLDVCYLHICILTCIYTYILYTCVYRYIYASLTNTNICMNAYLIYMHTCIKYCTCAYYNMSPHMHI